MNRMNLLYENYQSLNRTSTSLGQIHVPTSMIVGGREFSYLLINYSIQQKIASEIFKKNAFCYPLPLFNSLFLGLFVSTLKSSQAVII